MKRLAVFALLIALALPAMAITATDPLFIPAQGEMMLDSDAAFHNNASGGDDVKYFGVEETFTYGISDRFSVYGSLGIARVKAPGGYKEWGLTDPTFGAKYRIADDIAGDWILDAQAVFSPSLFDSPADNDSDGVAKGSTDFGFGAMLGKQFDEWTLAAYTALQFAGSTDTTDSATDFYIGALGKLYLDDVNSLDGNFEIGMIDKRFSGDDRDTAVKFAGGYARVLAENLDLSTMLGFVTHSGDDLKGEIFLSAGVRWRF